MAEQKTPRAYSDKPTSFPWDYMDRIYESENLEQFKRRFTRENVNKRDSRGYSPLMWACTNGNAGAVMHLLGLGANVNHTDVCDVTPLHVASFYEHEPIVKILLDNGAHVDHYTKAHVGFPNCNTPLHFALNNRKYYERKRSPRVTRLLLEAGADVNARNGKGETPLHFCRKDSQNTKILLEAGAKMNVFDLTGKSPLHCLPSIGCIRLLIDFGADVNLVDSCGNTPLDCAVDEVQPSSTSVLLNYWAGVEVQCNRKHSCGRTVFMCCWFRCIENHDIQQSISMQRARKFNYMYDCFSGFYILAKVSGLAFSGDHQPSSNIDVLEDIRLVCHLNAIEAKCMMEWSQMSNAIRGLTVTYQDVLYKRGLAFRDPRVKKMLNLKHCKINFPRYGGLLRTRFVTGQRRVLLIDKCIGFFALTSPSLPPECHEIILSHLDNAGLRDLGHACPTIVKKCAPRKHSLISKNDDKPHQHCLDIGREPPQEHSMISKNDDETHQHSLKQSEESPQKHSMISKNDDKPQPGLKQGGVPAEHSSQQDGEPSLKRSKPSFVIAATAEHSSKQDGEPFLKRSKRSSDTSKDDAAPAEHSSQQDGEPPLKHSKPSSDTFKEDASPAEHSSEQDGEPPNERSAPSVAL